MRPIFVLLYIAILTVWLTTACSSPSTPAAMGPIDVTTFSGQIVFDNSEDIFTINADGTDLKQLTKNPGAEFDPMWSPDGTQIVYRDSRRGMNQDDEIYVMNADGSSQTNLSNSPSSNEWGPAWSPDGKQIAFNSNHAGGLPQLYIMNADGSNWKQLGEQEAEYPSWSPDGSRIVFMSSAGSSYDIYIINSDGSNLIRLTDTPGEDGWPAWSPDGQKIVFESERDDCRLSDRPDCETSGDIGPFFDLWVMNPDGSEQTRLTEKFAQFSAWSPDSQYVIFNSFGGLFVIRPDGSDIVPLPINGAGTELLFSDWIP
jgi:Tol biopolymer transport system component